MLEIAGGNLQALIPYGGTDEIAGDGDALENITSTAVELEEGICAKSTKPAPG